MLFGLAVLAGHALDRESRDAAWGRIATARRTNDLRARELDAKALALHVWEDSLEQRERRVDQREEMLMRREDLLEQLEQELRDGPDGPAAAS